MVGHSSRTDSCQGFFGCAEPWPASREQDHAWSVDRDAGPVVLRGCSELSKSFHEPFGGSWKLSPSMNPRLVAGCSCRGTGGQAHSWLYVMFADFRNCK